MLIGSTCMDTARVQCSYMCKSYITHYIIYLIFTITVKVGIETFFEIKKTMLSQLTFFFLLVPGTKV